VKFSIVTISFNQARFLEEAIQSVVSQDEVEKEYILIDPGSNDGSMELISKYRSTIDRIVFEADNGPADGLNKGFALATGDVFGYLNADDKLLPGTLKRVSDIFSKNPNIDVVCGHANLIDEDGKVIHRIFSHRFNTDSFWFKRYLYGYSVIIQQSTFFRKECFKRTGGFDTRCKRFWDAALTMDLALAGCRYHIVHEVWSCFRIHSSSITGSGKQQDESARIERLYLQERVGERNVTAFEKAYLHYLGWLRQPKLLLERMIDAVRHPKRVL